MVQKKIISVDFSKGENLPDRIRNDLNFFDGIVEITVSHGSPYTISFKPLKGTFSDNLIRAINGE